MMQACDKQKLKTKIHHLFIFIIQTTTMKTRKLEMQYQEWQHRRLRNVLRNVALFCVLLWAPQDWLAQNISGVNDGALTTDVVKKDSICKKIEMMPSDSIEIHGEDLPWIEPDPEDDKDWVSIEPDPEIWEEDEWMPWDEWTQETEKKVEKKWSSVHFSLQSWLWYSVTGWDALWVNRFVSSGTLFKGSKWEISVLWIADLDDPLHTKWSWKLIFWKKLYKGTSLDWDYTFTWTWDNVFRFGMWYGGQLWDGSYAVKIFPLNTNWSPMSAKVSISTKVWKNWSLSSFVFVDLDTKWYYSETEYVHQLAQWIAAFVQARLMWTMDGKFTGSDGQILMWWLQIDL